MDRGGLDKTSSKFLTRFAKSEAGRGSAKSTSVLSSNRRVAVIGETWKTTILPRFCRREQGGGAAMARRLACPRFMSVALPSAVQFFVTCCKQVARQKYVLMSTEKQKCAFSYIPTRGFAQRYIGRFSSYLFLLQTYPGTPWLIQLSVFTIYSPGYQPIPKHISRY